MDYIPVTEEEKQEMLSEIGVKNSDELFSSIPKEVRIDSLNLPVGISESKLINTFSDLSSKNASADKFASYLGAGIYEHFIPALVDEIVNRSEFATAYTPYQPEASQGTLQAMFEYQSLICELTGLDISNASLYDGATAVAEAALLSLRSSGKNKVLAADTVNPEYLKVLNTYLKNSSYTIDMFKNINGSVDAGNLGDIKDYACLIVQSPNFYGIIEDLEPIGLKLKENNVLFVTVVNPLSLGVLKSPAEAGSDITVGEGQVLGNKTAFGGFTFGFMACSKKFAWKMPGRIAGKTVDVEGKRGFVLTLQTREQHIRREKATSNICTNSQLNALAACVYMAGLGSKGIKNLGNLNISKSRYAFNEICKLEGFKAVYPDKPFFNEFVIETAKDIKNLQEELLSNGIIGPLDLGIIDKENNGRLLFCVTETKTKENIDKLVYVLSRIKD